MPKPRTRRAPQRPPLPDGDPLIVPAVAAALAARIHGEAAQTETWLRRQIDAGRVRITRELGSVRIPRAELLRLVAAAERPPCP